MQDTYFSGFMHKFFCDSSRDEDVTIAISRGKMIEVPLDKVEEMRMHGHLMRSYNGHVFGIRSENDKVTYFKYNDEYTRFELNINDSIALDDATVVDELKNEISAVLRRIFIMLAAVRKGVCLHSVSIKHQDNAIMFSAVSGTGKTTHANLWQEVFECVEIINGDNGYLVVEDNRPYLYGSPWCGTSADCLNVRVPLKAVVFIEQAKKNSIEKLGVAEAFMRLSSRCFMPIWDNKLMLDAINSAEVLANTIECYLLKCLPDRDAVRVCYDGIYSN